MKREWTLVGTTEPIDRSKIEQAISNMVWHTTPYYQKCAGIKEVIYQFRIPRVSEVADSSELSPYGLVGVYGHYLNAHVRSWFLDCGDHITPLCMEFDEIQSPA